MEFLDGRGTQRQRYDTLQQRNPDRVFIFQEQQKYLDTTTDKVCEALSVVFENDLTEYQPRGTKR